jgi:hypothetical protein
MLRAEDLSTAPSRKGQFVAVRQEERRRTPAWALGRQVLSDVRTLNALGYFVIFRGLTWLLAAALVAVGNAPAAAYGPLLLLALAQTVALMAYRPGIQQRVRGWLEHGGIRGRFDDYLIIGTLDILLGLALVAASGGWRSPFYHYAVVAVMVPAFVSGFGGAFRWASAYAAAYLLVVLYVGGGLEGLMLAGGLSSALSGAVTPYLIAVAVSYYGQVSRRLEEEKERVEAALADNARLTAEKEALAAERERDRIAREIHDGIAQSLYILSLQLEACADLTPSSPRALTPWWASPGRACGRCASLSLTSSRCWPATVRSARRWPDWCESLARYPGCRSRSTGRARSRRCRHGRVPRRTVSCRRPSPTCISTRRPPAPR